MKQRILAISDRIKDNWTLCCLFEGVPHASEKEYLVAETMLACRVNHATHGECFSFKGNIKDSGGGLARNIQSYDYLKEKGFFEEKSLKGRTVIVPTEKLLLKLENFLNAK